MKIIKKYPENLNVLFLDSWFPYKFYKVFTIPWQLRIVCLFNRKVMFELLFKAVNVSIQSWTKKYGNYIPGFYTVLHTFGSDIKFNPHFHVLKQQEDLD